jgi:hypothetical protein
MSRHIKIYKIYSQNTEKVYIGCTSQLLRKRFNSHKYIYRQRLKGNTIGRFCKSYLIFECGDVKIEVLEEFVTDDTQKIKQRELYHILNYGPNCVNVQRPGRTTKQHRLDNLEHYKQVKLKYYQTNGEEIKRKEREKYQKNKIEITKRRRELYLLKKQKLRQKQEEEEDEN